jgi:acetyl-CoA carboxylase, biotin carboxylase subunit
VFRRVLIANRGEVAVRIVRACHELGIEAVAVYSTADRDSLHVRLADDAVHVGPPPAAQSYLNIPSLVAAATTTGCEAVHPGWGFLAENAEFAAACEDNDLAFVGPRPESIEIMGDKIRAKEAAAAAGLPLVPGSSGEATLEQARALAEDVGFPLLLKAAAGGGGRGMRLVDGADELEAAFRTATAEAEASFSDGSLYVERALVGARHVEIQVLGDGEGAVLTLGERDCSIQRRHQKLVEEGPSPGVSADLRAEMERAARRAAEALRYRGAGTLEFLLDADGRFYFIEMNTRLQVEHPVTELVTGIDLAQAQLRVAAGEGLAETGSAELRGHAIELRINAEDPARGFLPAPGKVTSFRPPLGPGVRVDTHVVDGYEIPPFYDSLVAKVIVWGDDRPAAVRRARRALTEFELEGVPTTRDLALDILESDPFTSGRYTTAFIAETGPTLRSLGGEAP